MTTIKTLRLQYGQIPMQYEVQHCTLREHEDADPEMVGPYINIYTYIYIKRRSHQCAQVIDLTLFWRRGRCGESARCLHTYCPD